MKMTYQRVFLVVLDSSGIGEAADAEAFGDTGANTLRSLIQTGRLHVPHLRSLGLGNIDGVHELPAVSAPLGAHARLSERSAGKDTTVGHWELAGHISHQPMPVFPCGFPDELIEAFRSATGYDVLCNRPYSGTRVIADYGDEHRKTGKLIVYTSADSVFQIAAHEDILPRDELYSVCRAARKLLVGQYGVGRVIARPFAGRSGAYYRTDGRQDFSLVPPHGLLPEAVCECGLDCISIGKISDIFADVRFTEATHTESNAHGLALTAAYLDRSFRGLCFVNLVDFDSAYGHRRDPLGYAQALNEFDAWLGTFLPRMREHDLFMITADHGCDPTFTKTTDHTREYVPLLVAGHGVRPLSLGTLPGFSCVGATAAYALGVPLSCDGRPLTALFEKE